MQKISLSLLGIVFLSTSVFSQKVINDVNVEKRTVGSFHGINVATGIQLVLTKGSTEEVAVSAEKIEYRDKISTKVENGILKIQYESKTQSMNKTKQVKKLKAYVSFKTLDQLYATSGATVKIEGVLKSSSLNLKANSGALVNGKVDIDNLDVSQSTGSIVTLSGSVVNLEIDGSTGSKFAGLEMVTAKCDLKVSTGAIISVNATNEIQVKANTGGKVKYKGNASKTDIKKSTGGTVSKI